MNRNLFAVTAILVVALVVLGNSIFQIDQRQQALVIRFGEPVRVVTTPGLKLKAPFLENVVMFDKRNLSLDAEQGEVITADQERLVVDAYIRYRINDPLQFYRTLRDERVAADRLERLVNATLRQTLGSATSEDVISRRRPELTRVTRDIVIRRAAASKLGLEVVDVRIKRADLPEANQKAVYERMQTARQQEAAQIRAVGEQQKREIIATATEESEKIRGEGDARRAELFASSFGRDASFAAFYRSMQAYEASLANGDATLVLSPDSAFFKYFERGPSAQ